MSNKFYITTPIYYVNDKPHIGHAYTTIVADVLARWQKQNNADVFFLTGTDEHGTKVAESAVAQGKTPQEFCDEISAIFQARWKNLNISNNDFIRTTSERHKKRVQEIFKILKNAKTPKGQEVIYQGEYKGLYCTGCEKFLTEKELVDGKCPDHKTAPEELKEKNYFFRLSDYKEILREKISNDEIKIFPVKRKNEALAMLEFIDDFSVSRETVKWGIDLPFDETQKAYVWVDALSNYLTAIGYPEDENYKKWWPVDAQLMAQDILKFHTIYWPAILMALDLPLPKNICIHGFFTIDGQKMSKSLGNSIDPDDLINKFGVDATRYLLLSQFAFGEEADVQVARFPEKFNSDLANGLGNLVARVSNLLEKNNIDTYLNTYLNNDFNHDTNFSIKLKEEFDAKMSEYKFNEALEVLWARLRVCDEIITKTEPWKMKDKEEIKKVLEPIAQDILNVAELLFPFMPETSEKIVAQFKENQIKKGKSLFPRINQGKS
jgi:methionyl-tRNA synthetase